MRRLYTNAVIKNALAMVNGARLPRRRLKRRVRGSRLVEAAQSHEQLVLEHLGMVRRLARSYARRLPQRVDRAELESAGTLGLMEAARRYNPTRGAAFATFAAYRVRGAMVDFMRKTAVYSRSEHRRLEAGADIGPRVAFDSFLAEQHEVSATTEAADPFVVARVRHALTQLPRREALILIWRFWHGVDQVACCPRLQVNASRISQLEKRALGRLRGLLADLHPHAGRDGAGSSAA